MLRVLNLEDTPDDSWLLQRHLKRAGYECVLRREQTALDFERALREGSWDIILADYFMPGFTALDALRIARECEPDLPFIVVSGAVGEQAAIDLLREGADDYVMKSSLARLAPAIKRERQEAAERRRRRSTEAALRESEVRLRGILDHSPNVVFMKDTEGHYILANHCYESLLGMSESEIRGKTDADLFHVDYALLYARNEAQVLQSGVPMQFEEQVPSADGVHTRLANRFPLFNESGRSDGVCTICTDITERMKQEDALRRSEKLATAGRLAASIAHEINNPLEGLINLLYLIQRQPELREPTRSMLTMAEQEVNRVSHIARQTLAFYQDSSSPTTVDLEETLKSLLELYKHKIQQREIHLDFRATGRCCIRAVRGEMRQAFANLLANAIDATRAQGHIRIRVKETREGSRSSMPGVRVTIADGGCGIPPENLALIFDAFFTTKDDGTGTGLGLWVTSNILKKHHARLRLRSSVTPGASGTVFSIFLPDEMEAQLQV